MRALRPSTYDSPTRTATYIFAAVLPDGQYTATLVPGAVSDLAANALAPPGHTFQFFVLAADANRDRRVDFNDLAILAQNYNTTGKTFAQGNFDYDPAGNVGFNDLALLAQRYNTALPPVAGATVTAAAVEPALATGIRQRSAEPVFNATVHVRPPPPPRVTRMRR